jgi:ATP-dependent Clp protease ATP-binding subunit ClpB
MKRHVANGLSQALLDGTIEDGDAVRIELADDEEEGLTLTTVPPTATASDASTNGTAAVGA